MVLFTSSTWLIVVVFVNVVAAANIHESKDTVKASFLSLLKNIVDINEKRINAMKHINDEHNFRLGSYLSKIHKLNEDSQEDDKEQKAYLSIIDMRRNLNLAFRETYRRQPSKTSDAKMVHLFDRFLFETLKINHKDKLFKNNDKIIELPNRYQSEPDIIEIKNKKLNDDFMDDDIIEPKKYSSKPSIEDNVIAKIIKLDELMNSEKKEQRISQKDYYTIKLPRKYLKTPSIQYIISKIIQLNDSYQKKINKVSQKEDNIRKLQDILNIQNKTHRTKDHYGNILRNIVNNNCNDGTQENISCENDKKKHNCCIFDGKVDVKCEDNVDLAFNFDDGKEVAGSAWTDWSYEFEGEALSSWETNDGRQKTRRTWRGSCDKKAAKSCRSACSRAHKNVCLRYKCTRRAKQAFKKECKRTCTAEFVASKYSEERR